MMFSVVHFFQEDTIEGVPTQWLCKLGNDMYCYWPDKHGVTSLIKRCVPCNKSWQLVKCTVKYTAETYEEMREKCKMAIYSTANENTEEEHERQASSSNNELEVPSPPTKRKATSKSQPLIGSKKSTQRSTKKPMRLDTDSSTDSDIPVPVPPS